MITYIGMVKSRPALTNTYVNNILKMLGSSNALNTSLIYSKNVKDIVMNNEQVALYKQYGHLRDYTGIGILLLAFLEGCLRYSPLFCKGMKIGILYHPIFVYVCKLLKKNFSISHHLAFCPTPTPMDSSQFKRGEDKLDPNWVTGFVDAEGCFSVIIEISKDLKRKVKVSFEINLHKKDTDILYKIQSFFGLGAVYTRQDKPISWYLPPVSWGLGRLYGW